MSTWDVKTAGSYKLIWFRHADNSVGVGGGTSPLSKLQ